MTAGKQIHLSVLFVGFILLMLPDASHAASRPVLTPVGYGGGGRFTAVAVHPDDPGIVLVGSDVAGVFKSSDGGDHFRLTGQDLDGFAVADIAFHPTTPRWVFLLCDGGLYMSSDTGDRWHKISGDVRYGSRFFGSHLLVFSRYSLWIGTDAGGVFQLPLNTPAPEVAPVAGLEGKKITALTLHENRLVAATAGGVYRYETGRWQAINNGLPMDARNIMDMGGDGDRRLYVVENSEGAYLWNREAARWESRGIGMVQKFRRDVKAYKALGVNPADSADIWLATDPETWPHVLLHSTDAGDAWRPVTDFRPARDTPDHWAIPKTVTAIESVVFSNARPATGFLTDWWNVWKTVDKGRVWHQLHRGLQNTVINDIRVHPSDSEKIYLSTWDNGLMVSEDGGSTWHRKMEGVADGHVQTVAFSRQHPETMFMLADPWHEKDRFFVYKSTNGGSTWKDIGFPKPDTPLPSQGFVTGRPAALVLDPQSDDVIYVGTNGFGVFKSVDAGRSWQPASSGLDTPYLTTPDSLRVHPSNSRILYASTQQGGVYKSTDAAGSWRRLTRSGVFAFGMAMDPADPDHILVAAAQKTLLETTDGGQSWSSRTLPGDRPPHIAASTVAFHPDNPAVILVGTQAYDLKSADGIYWSTDGGANFSSLSIPLPRVNVKRIWIRPTPDLSAYIGYSGIGVFRIDMEADAP